MKYIYFVTVLYDIQYLYNIFQVSVLHVGIGTILLIHTLEKHSLLLYL